MPVATPQKAGNRQLAEEVYTLIMGKINTDLLLQNIPALDEKYKGESPVERKKRMNQYKESYKKFDQELEKFMGNVHQKSRKTKHEALRKKERESIQREQKELKQLGESFLE